MNRRRGLDIRRTVVSFGYGRRGRAATHPSLVLTGIALASSLAGEALPRAGGRALAVDARHEVCAVSPRMMAYAEQSEPCVRPPSSRLTSGATVTILTGEAIMPHTPRACAVGVVLTAEAVPRTVLAGEALARVTIATEME